MAWKYSYQKKWDENTMAKAVGTFLPISPKVTREICVHIKNRKVLNAIMTLERVIKKQEAVPYKRYNKDRAHRRGMMSGGYPVKASKHVILVIQNAIANAQNKGLDENYLKIMHAVTHRAISKERRRGKYAHVEIIVEEQEAEKPKKTRKEEEKPKTEPKKTEAKIEISKPKSPPSVKEETKKIQEKTPKTQPPSKKEKPKQKEEVKK